MSADTTTARPRPRQHPRLAERRRHVARAAGQRRLGALAAVTITLALLVSALVLAHSSVFGARHVAVVGATHTDAAAIVRASRLSGATPMLDVGDAALAGIERLPWIATARIERHFPDSVTIVVTERHPVAAVRLLGGTVAIVDPSGKVLEIETNKQSIPAGLVPLELGIRAATPGEVLPTAGIELVAAADALPERLLRQVSLITTKSQLGVVVELVSGATARLGTVADLAAKYLSLNTLVLDGALSSGVLVDLRVPADPVLIR